MQHADSKDQLNPANKSRRAFKADFDRATKEATDSACLSTDEILSLAAGLNLDPVALDHLAQCKFCWALHQALQVDDHRRSEFLKEVHRTQIVPMAAVHPQRTQAFDWRLPAAFLTSITSLAMVVVMFTTGNALDSRQSMIAKSVEQPKGPPVEPPKAVPIKVEVDIKRRSGPSVTVAAPKPKGTHITVKDYAPEVAAAVVLSKSELTLPLSVSTEVAAEAKQQAKDIVQEWLLVSNETVNNNNFQSYLRVANANATTATYDSTRNGFELALSGKGIAWVPTSALRDGLSLNRSMLKSDVKVNPFMPMQLPNGYVMTVK